jgi:hypothetical protein
MSPIAAWTVPNTLPRWSASIADATSFPTGSRNRARPRMGPGWKRAEQGRAYPNSRISAYSRIRKSVSAEGDKTDIGRYHVEWVKRYLEPFPGLAIPLSPPLLLPQQTVNAAEPLPLTAQERTPPTGFWGVRSEHRDRTVPESSGHDGRARSRRAVTPHDASLRVACGLPAPHMHGASATSRKRGFMRERSLVVCVGLAS